MSALGSLQRIQLKGFRSIREMDLELAPLNILIGANGAGKSNFIGFFKFMNKLPDKDLQFYVAQQGGADRFLHFGRRMTEAMEVGLAFAGGRYELLLRATAQDCLMMVVERVQFALDDTAQAPLSGDAWQALPSNDRESGLPKPGAATLAGTMATHLKDWTPYHFHDTSELSKLKGASSLHDFARLRPQGENLAAFLHGIRETAAYTKIVETIQRVAPFFQDFVFEPEPKDLIRLRWKHRGSADYFDAHMLSDGTLRFICLATLLLQPKLPTMLLLDEPELGLHPFAVQLLASMMQSASVDTQIIASTQSVTLANEFDWRDIVVVDQVDNGSRFRRLKQGDVANWLDEYGLGAIWEMNLLGGTP